MITDYKPGDEPVPVGAVVAYFGSLKHGEYTIIEHLDPAAHPTNPPDPATAAVVYPDGVAYDLWPVGMELKFGNRAYAVGYARRTSFTVVSLPPDESDS